MKSLRYIFTILILFSFILTGCSEKGTTSTDTDLTKEGYILEVEEGKILVAEDITLEKYEEIKDKTLPELDEVRISLIYLSYDNASSLNVGNKVKVWIDGGINESYPAQARAKKIEVKN